MLKRLARKLGRGLGSKECTKAEGVSQTSPSPRTGHDSPAHLLDSTQSENYDASALERGAEAKASPTPTLAFAAAQATGCREKQEDRYCLSPQLINPDWANGHCSCSCCPTEDGSRQSTGSDLHFFAVYDGHGGSDVAQHCADRLHEHLRGLLSVLNGNPCTEACPSPWSGPGAKVQRQSMPSLVAMPDNNRASLDQGQPDTGEVAAMALPGMVARPTSWHAGDGAAYIGTRQCRSQRTEEELMHSLSEVDCSKHEQRTRRQWHKHTNTAHTDSMPASCSLNCLEQSSRTILARNSGTSSNSTASSGTPSTQLSPVGSSVPPCSPTHLHPIIESADWTPSSVSTPVGSQCPKQQQKDSTDTQRQQHSPSWPHVNNVPSPEQGVEQALVHAFLKVDAEVCGRAASEQGCTAVVALLSPGHLWVANCGDSRAVLVRDDGAVVLSADHKASRSDEVARIQAAGGFVWWHRVMGELAVSRAIGDHSLRPFVIAEPEVTRIQRCAADQLLLLASDGLWDVMSSQEASELAMSTLRAYRNAGRSMATCTRKVAAALSGTALTRGSKDNITVVVVDASCERAASGVAMHHNDVQRVACQHAAPASNSGQLTACSIDLVAVQGAGLLQTAGTLGMLPRSASSPRTPLQAVLPGLPVRSKPVSSIFPLAQPDWTDWPDHDAGRAGSSAWSHPRQP